MDDPEGTPAFAGMTRERKHQRGITLCSFNVFGLAQGDMPAYSIE